MSDVTGRVRAQRGEAVDVAVRVQILAAEHASLVATRNLTWGEMFTRATIYITVLSAAVVAVALVAQATGFGPATRLFTLLVLGIVVVIGLLTFVRLGEANTEDIGLVVGMNRVRRGYLDIAPDLDAYFVTASHDDHAAIQRSYGPAYRRGPVRFLAGTPALVAVVTAVLVGVLGAIVASAWTDDGVILVAAGILATAAMGAVEAAMVRRAVTRGRAGYVPRFPTPPGTGTAAPPSDESAVDPASGG